MSRQPTPSILDDVLTTDTTRRTMLALERIKTDGGTQMRAALDTDTVQEYLDAMQPVGWGDFPAVVVYYDGKDHWLADGFHRVEAYRLAAANLDQPANVPADVRSGTRRDAILHAAGANASHGLRRTNADKRRAVETLLRDDDWRHWSNREIGRRCNVSESFVREVKKDLGIDTAHETQYIHPKTGEQTTMQTANIGTTRTLASTTPARFALSTDDLPADLIAAGWTVRSKELGAYWVVNETNGFESAVVRGWDNFTELCASLQKRLPSHALTMASAISNQQSPISNPAPVRGYSVMDDIALRKEPDAPLPEWAEAPDVPPERSYAGRRLTADEVCTALLGQAIVDAYTVAGVLRITLDNNQLVTISSPSGGIMYAIEEA